MTDHTGNLIPADEPLDTPILVWQMDPHPYKRHYMLWERSYRAFIKSLGPNIEFLLEQLTDEEAHEGVTIRIKLIETTRREYEEARDA